MPSKIFFSRTTANLLQIALIACASLGAQTSLYFDANGTSANSGIANGASQSWDSSSSENWNTNSAGTGTPGRWSAVAAGATNGTATFSAGGDAGSSYTVNVSGTITNLGGLRFEEGDVTLAGGTGLVLGQNAIFAVARNLTATIATPITGGAHTVTYSGPGTLKLTGANTYTGGTNLAFATGSSSLNFSDGTSISFGGGSVLIGRDSESNGGAIVSGPLGTGILTFSSGGGTLSSDSTAARSLANPIVFFSSTTLGNRTNNGSLTFSGSVDLGGSTRYLTIESSVTISGVISNGALYKFGADTLTLTGANTYSGGTTLSEGSIRVGADSVSKVGAVGNGPLGTGTVIVFGDRVRASRIALSSDSTTDRAIYNPIVIRGDVTFGAASNTASNNGSLTLSGAVMLEGNSSLNPPSIVTVYSPVTITGNIGGGVLTKGGSGALTLTGANTHAGGTVVSDGTLRVGSNTALGTGRIILSDGTSLSSDSTDARLLANPVFFGQNNLNTLGDAIGNGALTFSGPVVLRSRTTLVVASPVTFSGTISGAGGGLTKAGPGTLTLTGSSNSYDQATEVKAGMLVLGAAGALPARGFVAVDGGTLDLGGFTVPMGSLSLGGGTIQNGTVTSSALNTYSLRSGTVNAVLAGSANVFKGLSNTMLLVGANTYTGSTTILAGTLIAGGASPLGTGSVAVQDSATLVFREGASFVWKPVSLSTPLSGIGYNQIVLSGTARLELNSASLAPNFDAVAGPTSGNTFWNSARTWTIVAAAGRSVVTGTFTVNNSPWNEVGSFTVSRRDNLMLLIWTPVSKPVVFSRQPASQITASGGTVVMGVTAIGTPAPSYQWYRNGTAIPGATNELLVLKNTSAADSGTYACVATNTAGSVTSTASTLAIVPTANVGRLINLSVLSSIAAEETLTMGAVLGGVVGGKGLLARAVGPSLVAFQVGDPLPDPKMSLISSSAGANTVLASNDDWNGDATLGRAFAQTGAFGFADVASKDAAILHTALNPGNYVVQVSDAKGRPGTVLAELYDVSPATEHTPTTTRLINVSVNKQIGTGGSLTAGFVIGGTTARTVLIRAAGPGLDQFRVVGTMPNPRLDLYDQTGTVLASNDDWGGAATLAEVMQAVGAFRFANSGSADAALLLTLAPGNYSTRVQPSSGSAGGVSLVEVYEVP